MSKKVHAAILARDAAQFLAFKRAMGMGYRRAEFVLASFVRFVREQYGDSPVSLEQVVTRWATRIEGRKAVTVANEFRVVRQLCLFRRRSDPRAFVPDHAVAPVKESVFVPYIFSREEVLALLDAATRHEGRNMWARCCARSRWCCTAPACGWARQPDFASTTSICIEAS